MYLPKKEYGYVQRRASEYISQRMLRMELPGRRNRVRPQRGSWMDLVYFQSHFVEYIGSVLNYEAQLVYRTESLIVCIITSL